MVNTASGSTAVSWESNKSTTGTLSTDIADLNQLNFAFDPACMPDGELSRVLAYFKRQAWTNGVYRTDADTTITHNDFRLPRHSVVYFAKLYDSETLGQYYKLSLSLVLPTGRAFAGGDRVCVDQETISCMVQPLPAMIKYVFYGRNERYCPVVNGPLPLESR